MDFFNFLAADLAKLSTELECYFSKFIDTNTLKFKNYRPTTEDQSKITDFLEDLHPYFRYTPREAFEHAVGDYLNALLINSSYNKEHYAFSPIYDREWYFACFKSLVPSYTIFDETTLIEKFYAHYSNIVNLVALPPPLAPKGFCSLINLQDHLRSLVYWILDASTPKLNQLTIAQRAWLYGNVFTSAFHAHLEVTKRISFSDPRCNGLAYKYRRLEYIAGEDHHFTLAGDLLNYHKSQDNVPPEALAELDRLISYTKEGPAEGIYEEYKVEELAEVLLLELYHMILSNTAVKKCRHCGIYFVVTNLNVEYCDRKVSGAEKPCSEIGPKEAFKKKLEDDYPLKIYNRAYKTHYARVKNGKMTQAQFNTWYLEAKDQLSSVRAGKLDVREYEKWLKI